MKEQYLIALDLDGTLLNNESKISKATKEYLKGLDSKGYKIVITTGRPIRNAIDFYNELNLHSPLVAYNGARVVHPHDKTFKEKEFVFPSQVIKNILNDIPDEYIDIAMCETDDNVWMSRKDNVVANDFWYRDLDIIFGDLRETVNQNVTTFIIRASKEEYKNYIANVVSKYDGVRLRFWQGYLDRFCEVYYDGTSKASGLKYVCEYYGIPEENTFAFGDEVNDLEILKFVKHGYAMKNSSKALLKDIKNVTEFTNDEDGVIKELQKLIK